MWFLAFVHHKCYPFSNITQAFIWLGMEDPYKLAPVNPIE